MDFGPAVKPFCSTVKKEAGKVVERKRWWVP